MTEQRPVARLTVERAGFAVLQDLGRPGHAAIGVGPNGAADQHAARTANVLVGNADGAPLVEITGSALELVDDTDLAVAVTGAADRVRVDGQARPTWATLHLPAGAHLVVPPPRVGLRSYVAVNGAIDCPRTLGSVAPDPWLGVGRSLAAGDEVVVHSAYRPQQDEYAGLFRLAAQPTRPSAVTTVEATPGPELERLTRGPNGLASEFEVLPRSNQVGLRLTGPPVELIETTELLSRGVPIGAVEVTAGGGVIVLLRGRLVTAGYPVVAVVTSESVDRLGQLAPGDRVRISFCSNELARDRLHRRAAERRDLAQRVATAFRARGLAAALDPHHGDPGA